MKITKEIPRSITRDAMLSVLLYSLPVILMLVWFYFSGQRPWVKGSGGLAPGSGGLAPGSGGLAPGSGALAQGSGALAPASGAQGFGASGSGSKHVLGFLGP